VERKALIASTRCTRRSGHALSKSNQHLRVVIDMSRERQGE
jgi:hypothetical protein